MKADNVKRLKELEQENVRLKRIVADQVLEVARADDDDDDDDELHRTAGMERST